MYGIIVKLTAAPGHRQDLITLMGGGGLRHHPRLPQLHRRRRPRHPLDHRGLGKPGSPRSLAASSALKPHLTDADTLIAAFEKVATTHPVPSLSHPLHAEAARPTACPSPPHTNSPPAAGYPELRHAALVGLSCRACNWNIDPFNVWNKVPAKSSNAEQPGSEENITPDLQSPNAAEVDGAAIGKAANIPVSAPTPVVSVSPVVLPVPGRAVDLQMRVTAPATGQHLPILLLSHGQGRSNHLSSLNGYGPLVNFWAAHGFVVLQPTHLSSKSLSLPPETPGAPLFWRSRVEDMKFIVDHLERIEASVPQIAGRLDRSRIAVAGHSMGGHTAGMLLGAQLTDEDGTRVNLAEPRIKAGVLLAPPGEGGADLSPFAAGLPFFRQPSFAEMTTPTLVVVGDQDVSPHLTIRGADWHADPYRLSTGPKCLLTIAGGEHILGGVSGYDAKETTDESPERVATVQRLTWAYLRTALYPGNPAWSVACAALAELHGLGSVECKELA